MVTTMDERLIAFLESFLMDRRKKLIEEVLDHRTRYLTVVLEDIFQPQNASAVLRTAECFGIQDVHVIENKNKYNVNPKVVMGASKWLNIKKYSRNEENTTDAIHLLKAKGYRIVATTPHEQDQNLQDFDLSKGKTAILLGNELNGLTPKALEMADEYLKIPITGFTESLNISVSAAIILQNLMTKLQISDIDWKLSDQEKLELKFKWVKNSLRKPDMLIRKYLTESQL